MVIFMIKEARNIIYHRSKSQITFNWMSLQELLFHLLLASKHRLRDQIFKNRKFWIIKRPEIKILKQYDPNNLLIVINGRIRIKKIKQIRTFSFNKIKWDVINLWRCQINSKCYEGRMSRLSPLHLHKPPIYQVKWRRAPLVLISQRKNYLMLYHKMIIPSGSPWII